MADRTVPAEWQPEHGNEAETEEYYHRQWRAYGVRRTLALFFLYLFPVAACAFFWISRIYLHQPLLALTCILVWLAAALALIWWAGEFRCPRCRRRYAALGHRKGDTNLTRGIFDKVCSNCKLRKFERG